MRTARIALLVAALAAGFAVPARAHDLRAVPDRDLPAVRRFVALHRELDAAIARYRRLEARLGKGWLRVAMAEREVAAAEAAVADAERRLSERVRAAYAFGPGGTLEALLRARSLAEVGTISEYLARAISVDATALREAVVARAILTAARARSEGLRVDLERRVDRLRGLLALMERRVDRAEALAERARLERELEAQRRSIAELAARQGSWDLGVIGYGEDQSHLLALLGPSGGRSCETPDGLVETGQRFSGYASWYGWEFGGQPTATGAIFDPRLFTVANRWLPFGTFLRVRHGDRCAIVLVNDRGPYGRLERVLDLSMAAAEHLGVGVSWVTAEILLPADGLPGDPVG